MPGSTPKRGLPYPELADGPPDVAGDFESLATAVDAQLGGPLGIPPLVTAIDMVPLLPVAVQLSDITIGVGGALNSTEQAAVLCHLPRRIVGATRIRWKYLQDAGPTTGNYVLALFSSAGAKLIDTGTVAITGAASSKQVRSETIAATTFDAGLYYAFIGVDNLSAGEIGTVGVDVTNDSDVNPPFPNVAVRRTTGGLVVPATFAGFTDTGASTTAHRSAVPLMALSVG